MNTQDMKTFQRVAELLNTINDAWKEIYQIADVPADKGRLGEYFFKAIWGATLARRHNQKGWDGHLNGQATDVKYYPKPTGLLDINRKYPPDSYLVLAGRKNVEPHRPLVVNNCYFFAGALKRQIENRAKRRETSVWVEEWQAAQVYPQTGLSPKLSDDQIAALDLLPK